MSALSNSPNHFLVSLPSSDRELLEPHLRPLELPQGSVLHKAEETINRIYFPYGGVVSLVVGFSNGQYVEAGMLGRNSVIGGGAALDGGVALNEAISQVASSGVAGEAKAVKQLASQSETLRIAFARHQEMAAAQTQQVAACNALHDLEERLCRWLLQTRDLIRSDTLPLTQEFLGQMLGVRRTSVTLVARKLQEARLINYRRGHIHVIDVEGLQDSCCECYLAVNNHFGRIVGWTPDVNNKAARTGDH
jgi:CRP-like cAMP-binding protein